jgi:Prokaryotic N-terminal methylation motif
MVGVRPQRGRQRGLSIVELMVGIAVGLFVVAAATLVVSSQLNDNRRLLLEVQVQQDLRTTADIISRELRRAGGWGAADASVVNPALGVAGATMNANLRLPLDAVAGATHSIEFKYKRLDGQEGPYGYQLTSAGVIRSKLTDLSGYHDLTDVNTLFIEELTITPQASLAVVLPCPKDCPVVAGLSADYCWPSLGVRDLTIKIKGKSPSDASIVREITTQVRVRNDNLVFNPAGSAAACPAF